jgi:hypothetical protein
MTTRLPSRPKTPTVTKTHLRTPDNVLVDLAVFDVGKSETIAFNADDVAVVKTLLTELEYMSSLVSEVLVKVAIITVLYIYNQQKLDLINQIPNGMNINSSA